MPRVSIDDLRGLLEVIDLASTMAEGADEGAHIHKVSAASGNCYDWILREIRRREQRQAVRAAVKSAETYLNN